MERQDYFSFDEPKLYNKNIICAFFIGPIQRKHCYFYIIYENDKYYLYYIMHNSNDIIKNIRKICEQLNIPKNTNIIDVFYNDEVIKEYNRQYLKIKILDNQQYIKDAITKMEKDKIHEANNTISGLDGFTVELKLYNNDKKFESWCYSDDSKYFYVIDFIHSILDEVDVDKNYRIEKIEKNR